MRLCMDKSPNGTARVHTQNLTCKQGLFIPPNTIHNVHNSLPQSGKNLIIKVLVQLCQIVYLEGLEENIYIAK